ncbi:MAG: hypothetical protein WA681_01440, partial [Candidatus Acidiferrales bacterium]
SNCDPALASSIDALAVRNVWREFLAGRTSWSRPWSLFVLNEWVRTNLGTGAVGTAAQEVKSASAVF